MNKYTLMELLDFPIGTRFNRRNLNSNVVVEVEVELIDDVKRIICNATDDKDKGIVFTEIWAKAEYTKIEPTISFLEAWEAQEEGIEVVSSTGWHYKNNKVLITLQDKWVEFFHLCITEMKGNWQILK